MRCGCECSSPVEAEGRKVASVVGKGGKDDTGSSLWEKDA